MPTLFDPYSLDENATMLARHLPKGRVWSSGFDQDSNIGKLIKGLSIEFYRLEVLTKKISDETDIIKTDELLTDWEKSVGIPDNCFDTTPNIEDRREQIRQKLSNFGGVQKAEDFIRVAALFGFDVEISVIPGSTVGMFPLVFPVMFFDSTRSVTHTIFILITNSVEGDEFFPLEFPLPFSSGGTTFLQCIFNVLAPANVQVIVKDTLS